MDAVRKLIAAGLQPDEVDERALSDALYTAGLPDPDLVIRTGDEQRISNFLIWQSAYAELWFTDVLWPDFGADTFAGPFYLAYGQTDSGRGAFYMYLGRPF